MKEYFKKLMEKYFYEKNYQFKFEKVSDQVYAAAEEFTFTDKPLKDEVFVQKFIIDNEKISSVCALYHINITNYEEKFNELAELFMNQYDLSIRYDLEYEAIKVSMAIDNETIEDEEIEEENLMEYLTTFPALICRMFTYALLICVDDAIPPSEVFDDVMKDEDLFIVPEEISFDI